ncbi:hypothetical protein RB195_011659 [Necator americanus]|uniref:Uncharacterized protein n=1 Tax=Necator americanus TaxID=51031 RepID=A0ABR1D3G1_NECAM
MPERNMGSLETHIRLVTLNCWSPSSELQQAVLSRLLRYLRAPLAALQETRSDRLLISINNHAIYCGDADERKVGVAVRNDYNNLVEEFGPTLSRCAFVAKDQRKRMMPTVKLHLDYVLTKNRYPQT